MSGAVMSLATGHQVLISTYNKIISLLQWHSTDAQTDDTATSSFLFKQGILSWLLLATLWVNTYNSMWLISPQHGWLHVEHLPSLLPIVPKCFEEKENSTSMNDLISNMRTSREYLLSSTNDYVPNMRTIFVSDSKGLYWNEEEIMHSVWELWHLILAIGNCKRSFPENIKNCTQECTIGFHISSHKFVLWQCITAISSYNDKNSSWRLTLATLHLWTKIIQIHQPNKQKH